jgi:O-succinylbenzoic acid--CoA ligase
LAANSIHKKFQLNSISFSSLRELQAYTKDFSEDIHQFLESWFSKSEVIIVQTSGSTGTPKSISLKKEFVINSAKATGLYFNLQENTSALLCLPIGYIAGKMMLIRALTLGWKLDVIESNSHPLKEIDKAYDFCAMVPLQLENSLAKIHLIKKIIVGGGVVSNTLQEKLQNSATDVFATYGMTETITHIAVKRLNNYLSLQGEITQQSFYQTLPNVTIYKDDRNCLVIDAPKVAEEIIFTNDVVQLVSDRHFEWLGRFDNVINSGGIKLHPEKIEEKLAKIITNRFYVIGKQDEKLGEKLILVVEGSHQAIKFESIDLSKFEVPKETYFIAKFLETGTGKIQRKKTLQKVFTN